MNTGTTYTARIARLALRAAVLVGVCCMALTGCRIQPPLHLPEDDPNGIVQLAEVHTDVEVIWETDADWRSGWWYGWDEDDIRLSGPIEYPIPTYFEGRFYFLGDSPDNPYQKLDGTTIYDRSFRRRFDFGHHNMLIWSNIDSDDGTQVLIVNEDDPMAIYATTSRSRVRYGVPGNRGEATHNNPEIFYAGSLNGFYISRDPMDYDYFDEQRNAWVKKLNTDLYPLVYIYMVQVAIYNNKGRVTGMADAAAVNSMADGVNIHTGHTSNTPVAVTYEMRFKHDLPARDGRFADIFGGKLTTFGLCDMDSWSRSRGAPYRGSRTDLHNKLMLDLTIAGLGDSVYTFDITDQMQRQAHGGVLTIEIDADTLHFPKPDPSKPSSGFDANVQERDSLEYVFGL